MSGNWSESNIPVQPGVFINFETTGTVGAPAGPFGVVGVPITAAWGPVDEFTLLSNENELNSVYGYDNGDVATTTGWVARDAFVGGAAQVLVRRIGDGTEAKATKTLANATVTALTFTALYEGTKANDFGFTTRTNPLDATKKDLLILEGGSVRETYTYLGSDTTFVDLAAQINGTGAYVGNGSQMVTVAINSTLTALATVTNTLMTGGLNGGSPIAGDYLTAQDAFEREGGFDIFCLNGVSSSGIMTSLVAWTRAQNDAGRYVVSVVGGPAAESVSTAVTRAQGYANEFVVSLGGQDFTTVLPDGTVAARSSAQLVGKIAGMIASSGIASSITRMVVPNVKLDTPLTDVELKDCISGGVLPIIRQGDRVIVADGVTTYSVFTDAKDGTFGSLSAVRAMQEIGVTTNRILETEFLGKKRNTLNVQNAIKARILGYLQKLEAMDVLINGTTLELDTRYTNTGYSIYLIINASFGYELKRVLITLRAPGLN